MKKKSTWILSGGLILLLVAAVFLYNGLKDRVSPENELVGPGVPESGKVVNPGSNAENGGESVSEPEKMLAPDFTVYDRDGGEITLSSFRGKPVVLNFWASWCPPCKEEMPDFNNAYEEMGEDVVFMMINMTDGQRETQQKGMDYVDEQGYTFPVYFDIDQAVAYAYGVTSLPTSLFIDAEGYLVTGAMGMITKETLQKGIGMLTGDTEANTAESSMD